MKKILIIEDNQEVRENLEEILELYGYQTIGALNGKLGVEQALVHQPDLILCDVMMPELDGFGVLNILSRKVETAGIPFIFLTAKSEKEDFRRGMNLGADDYITKPFYKDELLQVVETRLAKAERLREAKGEGEEPLSAFINEARGYQELQKLSDEHQSKSFSKKEHLFREGDYPHYLYYVKAGKVKIYKTNDFGKELIINICQQGDFIGYTTLIKEGYFDFSATALEESQVGLIPKEDFFQLLYSNRDVASQFIKLLANNISDKEEQLLNLAYNSVRKRVANALLLLHDRYQEEMSERPIKVLREDLARIVGTAKESVIRMLTEFKEDGYIEITDGNIRILNLQKLRNMPG
ncbi:MAG: response regulator [Bacteroidota bacterium]